MKERPILFSAPMVRAILAGTKTQTRRVIGPHHVLGDPLHGSRWIGHPHGFRSENRSGILGVPFISIRRDHGVVVRWYGQPGDRLWVRETWAKVPASAYRGSIDTSPDGTRSVVPHRDLGDGTWAVYAADWTSCAPGRWRPSIHMPYVACRIVLEITDVRVQRLHDASDADLIAEGLKVCPPNGDRDLPAYVFPDSGYDRSGLCHGSPDVAFREGWESINGAGAWDANPWVWAISFRRVDA